jgi:hypothetical protein
MPLSDAIIQLLSSKAKSQNYVEYHAGSAWCFRPQQDLGEGQEPKCTWRPAGSGPGTGVTIRSAQHLWNRPRIWVMRDPGWDKIGRTGKLDVRCNAASNHSDYDFAGRSIVEAQAQALIQEHGSL